MARFATKKEPNGQGVIDWIEDQKNWIQKEMLERYGWEREDKGSHPRGNLSIPDYKVARAEERRQKIERQINKQKETFDAHINELLLHLDESVDKVWNETDDWEKIRWTPALPPKTALKCIWIISESRIKPAS